jgi:glycosyltransferase involved in cell wall biosynthesis
LALPGDADVSVVIPVLNEEEYLPALLASLRNQTTPVREIIVVDGGSSDGTHRVAEEAGALLLRGGSLPGVSRNYGAEWASGEWVLFLDADVRLPETAVQEAFGEMERRGLDSCSCAFRPDRNGMLVRLHHRLSWEYFWLASKAGWCHSIGAFLLVRRDHHVAIGGFDHTILVAEDQDYVMKLNRVGRYGFVRKPVVEIATRRFDREGFVHMSAKWLGIEVHRLLLGEIRNNRFRYFG